MTSLTFFSPQFMSLTQPHPLFTLAGNSPAKVTIATTQAIMLSGRYRFDSLVRHWTAKISGICTLSPQCSDQLDDIIHVLKSCKALTPTRQKLYEFTSSSSVDLPLDVRHFVLQNFQTSSDYFVQLLLDCTVVPPVIIFSQQYGIDILSDILTISRTWIYVIHRERLKLRGQWRQVKN